jgi:hypothetical protein
MTGTERAGRVANRQALDRLLEELLEPVGRQARPLGSFASVKERGPTAETLGTMDAMEAAIATQAKQQPADDAKLRAAQRARLQQLRDELVAEGADATTHLPQLQARADTWPE